MSDIYTIISEVLGIPAGELRKEDDVKDELGADSIDMVDILDRIESAFGIHIPDSEAPKLKTIQDFENYIGNHS